MLATDGGSAATRLYIPLPNGSCAIIAKLISPDMRLQLMRLWQFLGNEGITARRLPDSFDPMRFGHQYVAKLNDINTRQPWKVYQLESDEEVTD